MLFFIHDFIWAQHNRNILNVEHLISIMYYKYIVYIIRNLIYIEKSTSIENSCENRGLIVRLLQCELLDSNTPEIEKACHIIYGKTYKKIDKIKLSEFEYQCPNNIETLFSMICMYLNDCIGSEKDNYKFDANILSQYLDIVSYNFTDLFSDSQDALEWFTHIKKIYDSFDIHIPKNWPSLKFVD
jgi:hypothetical protein